MYAADLWKITFEYFYLALVFKIYWHQQKNTWGTFWRIRCIQIRIYTKTSVEPKYWEFYSKNKVRVHTLSFGNFASSTELKSSSPYHSPA